MVSGIDWSAAHNKIVTCSHDRNAFVWTYEEVSDTWKPALVILRIDRAAISVKWSLDGLKFAVGSSAKCVPVCTYEAANDWWVSKTIRKKIKSTVLCVAFHPTNGQLLAVGSSDFKCRVYSTFTSDVDTGGVSCAPHFETPREFGEIYAEMACMGWVNAVAWSPSGHTLCYAGHDSSIHITSFSGGVPVVQSIRFSSLPLQSLIYISERAVLGGGHDFNPMLFGYNEDENKWEYKRFLETRKAPAAATAATGSVAAARALFQNKSTRGQDAKVDSDKLWTKHENTITCMQQADRCAPDSVTHVSSTSLDGSLVMWELNNLDIDFAAMKI